MAIGKAFLQIFIVSTWLLFNAQETFASDETATAEALSKTQSLLRDPQQRQKAGAESTKAAATMKSVEGMVGPSHTQELYDLSADVLATITNRSKGNTDLMKQDAERKPEEFIKLLTPEQWAKIEALAKKIEAERGPSSTTSPPK